MKKAIFLFTCTLYISFSFGQNEDSLKYNIIRINAINPGIEYEHSFSKNSKLAANIGYGISMSYPELTVIQENHAIFLSPFLDVHYKFIYNLKWRMAKQKNVHHNTGDFVGLKFNSRGNSIGSGLIRTDTYDFSIGPTWGIQRNYGNMNLLFNLGPVYYFDTKGNQGLYPIMLEFNFGFNVWKSK